jgi:hypothetical protein
MIRERASVLRYTYIVYLVHMAQNIDLFTLVVVRETRAHYPSEDLNAKLVGI